MAVVTLFFGNRSYALLFLPLMIGGFYACNYLTGYHAAPESINLGFWGTFPEPWSWLFDVSAMILVLTNAILLNRLFNRNEFMERNNFLTSMLYVTAMSFFPVFYHLDGLAIAQTLTILSVMQIFHLKQNEDGRRAVFNAAFLFGTASTVYPMLLIGIPLLFWMVWVIRPFVLRESVLILVGFAIPLLYAAVYGMVFEIRMEKQHFSSSSNEFFVLDILVLGICLTLLGLSSVRGVLGKLRGSSIRLKKLFRMLLLLIWLFLGVSVLEFFIFGKLVALLLVVFPLIFFLNYAFGERSPKPFPSFLYYILFFFAVGKFFIPFNQIAF